MKMKQMAVGVALTMGVAGSYAAITTDYFGTGGNAFSINFVDIGGAGNAADSLTGSGAVDYAYRIGQTEITSAQFAAAYAQDSNIGSGSEDHFPGDTPVVYVSGYEAMKFANYLTTENAYKGAYLFDDEGMYLGIDRDAAVDAYGIVYVVPSADEWYKAAYYKPINDGTYSLYANGGSDTNNPPEAGWSSGWNYGGNGHVHSPGSGAIEQNGTYDMMGNVWEWDEAFGHRGGSLASSEVDLRSTMSVRTLDPESEYDTLGLRVAAIPEPVSMVLIGLFGGGILFVRRIFMK
ncbi:MAG: SUMF1/EgtB/PvdO family nonheme iron enzyme [Pontiella sp.]